MVFLQRQMSVQGGWTILKFFPVEKFKLNYKVLPYFTVSYLHIADNGLCGSKL
jgi:hypothetical protein